MDSAGELKYLNEVKKMEDPDEEFVKLFASKVHSGPITSKVRSQFKDITKKALRMFLRDSINERLSSVIDGDKGASQSQTYTPTQEDSTASQDDVDDSKVITTDEELEGFNIVRAILREIVPINRIFQRDTQSYFGVLLDDNNRKPLCRLHFNAKQKYIGVFDESKNETRIPIDSVDDIFNHAEKLKSTACSYSLEQ